MTVSLQPFGASPLRFAQQDAVQLLQPGGHLTHRCQDRFALGDRQREDARHPTEGGFELGRQRVVVDHPRQFEDQILLDGNACEVDRHACDLIRTYVLIETHPRFLNRVRKFDCRGHEQSLSA
jgi:hypothetical protein